MIVPIIVHRAMYTSWSDSRVGCLWEYELISVKKQLFIRCYFTIRNWSWMSWRCIYNVLFLFLIRLVCSVLIVSSYTAWLFYLNSIVLPSFAVTAKYSHIIAWIILILEDLIKFLELSTLTFSKLFPLKDTFRWPIFHEISELSRTLSLLIAITLNR